MNTLVKIQLLRDPNSLSFNMKNLPFLSKRYALTMENLLRQVDCQITLPFWNFALHSKNIFKRRPGYHMWDKNGGFGSTKTHVKNGFCIEDGPFKWPNYKLPKFFVRKLDNTDRKTNICPNKPMKKSMRCNEMLENTFQPRCVTRSISHTENTPTYEQTYRLLHNKKTKFDRFELFVRNDCHASVHDNLGEYTSFSRNKAQLFSKLISKSKGLPRL